MVRAMSQTTRLAATALLSLVVGAAGGAYATRLVYGDGTGAVDPSPEPRRTCPPCPDCPTCPEPPPCDTVSDLPTSPDPIEPYGDLDVVDTATDAPDDLPRRRLPDPDLPRGPGLSAGTIQQAFSAVRLAVGPCLIQASEEDRRGMVLLSLTVTATGTEGFVTDAVVSQSSGDVASLEECLRSHAEGARFPHRGSDGSQRLKVPLRIGD